MKLQGNSTIGMDREKLYKILSNPEEIAKLVPGIQSYEKEGDWVKMVVMVGYSFIKGKFNVKIRVLGTPKIDHVELKGVGSGAGTSIDFLSKFELKEAGKNASSVSWDADVNVGGIAAAMGNNMIKSAADKFITEVIDGLKKVS
ncbi:MAG: SRPBCC domain-containing protein [Candidatus Marsarchaeota archaeon]|nr:SRPBCC domain-containing protein [Candidatus Marsarchaeota archaeon]MCL5102252.1 SRPBCC domain-containing protein [Candidatus Marsarchaeota archaeon]